MRLLSWSLSSRLRGWQGKGQIWQPTLAMGSKFVTPPMLWPQGPILTCSSLCQRCPVAWRTANAAQPTEGGFKFPWLGLWNSRGVVLPPDVAPNEDWDYYYRHQERMDLLLVGTFPNFTTAADLVPQELYALQLRCSAGDTGQVGMGELFDQWRTWLACIGSQGILANFVERRSYPRAEAHRTLAPARQRVAGLCFSDEGRPWTILRSRRPCRARWRSCWTTGGDHCVLLASHGSDTCAAAGVPPRVDGCTWRLAEQRRSGWPDGLPLLISEVCSLHQDQVFGVGSRIQAD